MDDQRMQTMICPSIFIGLVSHFPFRGETGAKKFE